MEVHSKAFEGKRLLQQHRMVSAAMAAEVEDVHAIQIHTAVLEDE